MRFSIRDRVRMLSTYYKGSTGTIDKIENNDYDGRQFYYVIIDNFVDDDDPDVKGKYFYDEELEAL